ncbi:tRNA nucleotidyltransferase cca2 [Impatiens glandulifera]|uniref:tRNA nucleotidyltransferase cca2 n=1 Tax=Impatiens glandulifera TaxID=253017 RepID=UPI001FB10F9B|nr:tRNA nucleotidyltransferase cca2 [Impatiens glandulifera]
MSIPSSYRLLTSLLIITSRFPSNKVKVKPFLLPPIRYTSTSPLRPTTPGFNFNRLYGTMLKTETQSAISPSLCSPPLSVQVRDNIHLTEKEEDIFECLRKVLLHFSLKTQLRVAGGWVRDKLLDKECYDIDIAIDDMLGREFCEKVNEYLSVIGEEAHTIGVIQCNPDQSKHLETARMRLSDMWIDFVNLRAEDYSENSRIPTMRFGSAKEDAYRRDLTINSLFYNINTRSVEDLTERGIADLKSGRIVTPLPPKETFLDDPLRVLRAIRFAARFEFKLEDDLKTAASDNDVKTAISEKISRERIGHEIDLMVSGNQPVTAMSHISDLQLFSVVFTLPSLIEPSLLEDCSKVCVAYMTAAWKLEQLLGCSNFNNEHKRLSLYAALFLPYRHTIYLDNKGKRVPVVNHIFRNSLKLKANDAETVMKVHIAAEEFISLIPSITSEKNMDVDISENVSETLEIPTASKLRVSVGKLLREIKDFWRVALLTSLLLHPTDIISSNEESSIKKRGEVFKKVENEIMKMGLEKVWEMKPLLDGKEIMSILQVKTGGPVVKEWQVKLLEWQLAFPLRNADDCREWMRLAYNAKRARIE